MLLYSFLISAWISDLLGDHPLPHQQYHQYFPYHQHLNSPYLQTQPTRNSRSHHSSSTYKQQRKDFLSHPSSPTHAVQPAVSKQLRLPQNHNRHHKQLSNTKVHHNYQRKPILIKPTQHHQGFLHNKNDRRSNIQQVPAFNYRATRKIKQTPLKTGKNHIIKKQKEIVKKYPSEQKTFQSKNDNLAIESFASETKVKVPTGKLTTVGYKPQPQAVKSSKTQTRVKPVVAKVPVQRNYNSVQNQPSPKFIIKQAGPSQQYGWVGHGTYAPYNIPNIFQAAGINTRWIPGIDPVFQVGLLYPDPAPAQSMSLNSYSPPSNNYGSSVKVKKSIPNSAYGKQKEAIEISPLPQLVKTKPQEAPAVPPPYTGPATSGDVSRPASAPGPALNPAVPPAFTRSVVKPAIPLASLGAVANPAVPPSYTGPAVAPSFSKIAVSPSTIGPAIPPPYSAPISVFESPTTTPSTTPRPWNQGTLTPFINLRGSPTPQGYISPTTYKPAFISSTSKPFSLVIKSTASPKKISTKRPPKKEDEVFYIFYENDEKPVKPVRTGIDLQEYIEEEIKNAKRQSNKEKKGKIKRKQTSTSVDENEQVYFDVPIKIEENGEGFTPPSQIRKIFVPQENAANIFDINVGTSFGYNQKEKNSRFPSFSAIEKSSYSNPITSYDAPIAPSNEHLANEERRALKKIRKVKKERIQDSSVPFGARIGPKGDYDIIKRKR